MTGLALCTFCKYKLIWNRCCSFILSRADSESKTLCVYYKKLPSLKCSHVFLPFSQVKQNMAPLSVDRIRPFSFRGCTLCPQLRSRCLAACATELRCDFDTTAFATFQTQPLCTSVLVHPTRCPNSCAFSFITLHCLYDPLSHKETCSTPAKFGWRHLSVWSRASTDSWCREFRPVQFHLQLKTPEDGRRQNPKSAFGNRLLFLPLSSL